MAAAHFLCKLPSSNPLIHQINSTTKSNPSFVFFSSKNPPKTLFNLWLGVTSSLPLTTYLPNHHGRPAVASTVISSLPTVKRERVAEAEKVPKWSWRAIKSFAMGELEARKLKHATTGTEALLMGILVEGTNFTAKFLRAAGITLLKVREETIKLLGKGDLYFFSPEHPPLTEDAQRALDWAVDQKLKSGDNGEITTTHMLLGIWSEVESPGHKILAALGFSDDKAKELESFVSKPGFLDE